MKPKKTPPKIKKFKVLEKLKKLNIKNRKATNKELELIYKGLHVKYCRNLEDNIVNDSYIIANLQKTIHFHQKSLDENKKGIATLVDKYEDRVAELEEQLQECNSKRADITRAYNGLHTLGKFAEEQGIDIEPASDELPESEKNKYKFSQKHTVLESGKVKHSYTLKPKKNGEGK